MAIEAPVRLEDELFAGEDKVLRFLVTEADGVTKQNITGWQVQYDLRKHARDAEALVTKNTGSGIQLLDPDATGFVHVCDVTLAAADTVDLERGSYWHALWRTDVPDHAVLSFGKVALQVAGKIV